MQTHASSPHLTGFFAGIVAARFYDTWDFYTSTLGFRTIAEFDHYVRLRHPSGAQIAVLRQETDGQPAQLVSATEGRGFWLNIEVSDLDAEIARLRAAGVSLVGDASGPVSGDRSVAVRDPNGILIYLWHRTERTDSVDAVVAGASAGG